MTHSFCSRAIRHVGKRITRFVSCSLYYTIGSREEIPRRPIGFYRTNVSTVFARLSSRNGVLSLNDITVSILGCNNYGANRRKLLLYKMARHWP